MLGSAVGLMLALAPAADAANLTLSASISPTRIDYPGTRSIVYRLTLTTGEASERVRVLAIPPTYAGPPFAPSFRDLVTQGIRQLHALKRGIFLPRGSPIALVGPIQVRGPGIAQAPPPFLEPPPLRVIGPSFRSCDRGYATPVRGVPLSLPPYSTTTLALHARTGRSAPWPGMDYRVTFVVHRVGSRNERLVRPPRPPVTGPTGVRIRLHTRPALIAGPGQSVGIFGRTDPPVAHQWISLHVRGAARLRFGPPRLLATVRTDGKGRFRYTGWVPSFRLLYELWATYAAQQPGVLSDSSCSVALRVAPDFGFHPSQL